MNIQMILSTKSGVYFRIAIVCLTVAGFFPALMAASPPTDRSVPAPSQISLLYIGHACFRIVCADGTTIVCDPYISNKAPQEIAKFPVGLSADFLTISHFHPDHSNMDGVVVNKQKLFRPITIQAGLVKITGYRGDHGLSGGAPRGENTVFVFEIDGIKIVHFGAQGVITESDILAAIEGADVVTFDADGSSEHPAAEMLAQLRRSRVHTIILTHYSFSDATRYWGAPTLEGSQKLIGTSETLVQHTVSEILVMKGMPDQLISLTPLALSTQ